MTMHTRPEPNRDDARAHDTAQATGAAPPAGPGVASARRRALAFAGASAIAPGVRAATPGTPQTRTPTRLHTGWILRPDDR